MFSDPEVKRLADRFVCVKVDTRWSNEASQHKSTRYVPEVVFLDGDENVLGRLSRFDRDSVVAELTAMSRR